MVHVTELFKSITDLSMMVQADSVNRLHIFFSGMDISKHLPDISKNIYIGLANTLKYELDFTFFNFSIFTYK